MIDNGSSLATAGKALKGILTLLSDDGFNVFLINCIPKHLVLILNLINYYY